MSPEALPINLQVRIRLAASSDLPALEWDGEYIHFRRLYADVFRNTITGKALMWVVELPDKGIIGQVFVSLVSGRSELANGIDRAYLYGFRVKPAYRNHGIGEYMLRTVENDLLNRGFSTITLNVAQDNILAMRLYKRLGYQVVAEEAGVWSYLDHLGMCQQVHEPAWRMEKVLKNK